MALKMWTKNNRPSSNWRGLGSAILVLSIWSGQASALEIKSTVSKVDEAGKIEISLPAGAMVSVGDKVRIQASTTADTNAIKTRWTVKDIKEQTILASPDGEPTSVPKVGFDAVINTIADQPVEIKPVAKASEPAAMPEVSETPAPETEAPEIQAPAIEAPTAEMPKTVSEPLAVEDVKKPDEAMATDMQAMKQQEPEVAADASPDISKMGPKDEASKLAEALKPEVDAVVKSEQQAVPTAPELAAPQTSPIAPESEDVAPASAKNEAEKTEPLAIKQEEKIVSTLRGNVDDSPAPELACDRLAAHPFDPDAVVKGVDYKQLNAEKIIAACNEALADYPSEARFYTQLTRGLHKAGKLNEAFDATKKGADLGSAHSMAYLAVMYKLGEPIAKDLKKSLFWFEKAAENGNPGGMIFAAAMYRDGTGTPRDYKRAAKLYQQASDLDIAEAMSSLAVFYDRGQGVEKSPESAASYLLKALLGDDKQAQQLLFEASGAISKETRQKIQTTLQKEGFYKGKIDGDFGSRTRQALTRYRSGRKGG